MRKSKNVGGKPIFVFKVEMPVSKGIFAKAIAGYCHESNEEFNKKTSKKDALKILKDGLQLHGIEGISTDNWDGASIEFLASFQDGHEAAIEWIERNYPYLK